MPVKTLYESDCDLSPLQGKTVAVCGYGSQGHAHALNLRDSGVKVIVAQRPGGKNYDLAIEHGFVPVSIGEASATADLLILTLPDELQGQIWADEIAPNLRSGSCIGATHGFNFHFKAITPPSHCDVVMIAPKGPGHTVRSEFEKGGGVPCLLAVFQDRSGHGRDLALAWARGIGGARGGVIETTFKDECETDLFGEQTVLCGGVAELIKAGFDTLVEAGYEPEMAFFECMHELQLITNLIYQGGLSYMWYSVSNTAEYGGLTRGRRIITDQTRAEMKKILAEIQSGQFAQEWLAEVKAGMGTFRSLRKQDAEHGVEQAGRPMRRMMKWIAAKEV